MLDGGLSRRAGRRRRYELASTTAAEREGAKQRVVEGHRVPDGAALDRLVAGRSARRDRPQRVEVGQRRIQIGGVDVVGLEAGGVRLEVSRATGW